ncbi:hypothetical protein BDN70DRAFT_920941 [Pholiota conissans]|uniref:Uncharacterized protein n=1 Tax=Pholiota conissans TaxID=109636 RepID=A0A9P5Z2A9_9AGAR|nr:hypothetical protein BDN70DRAFT_920941 [Pholiota conissans]
MRFSPGAGLLSVIVVYFTSLLYAAPLPFSQSSHSLASTPGKDILRHSSSHVPFASTTPGREEAIIKIKKESSAFAEDEMFSRDIVELVRRKSVIAKIKQGFKKMAHGIKRAAQKIGRGIKTGSDSLFGLAAKKVGHFMKTTGAKIVKVGLKIMATAGKIAAKVANFIPGIGKAVSKGIEAVSTVRDKISNAIHVNIGGKLGKAMHRMDKAQKVVGYIP